MLTAIDIVIEIVVAIVLFSIIAVMAAYIDKLLLWFISYAKIPESIAAPLKAVKYIIFLLDLAIFIMFALGAFKSAWRKLWK